MGHNTMPSCYHCWPSLGGKKWRARWAKRVGQIKSKKIALSVGRSAFHSSSAHPFHLEPNNSHRNPPHRQQQDPSPDHMVRSSFKKFQPPRIPIYTTVFSTALIFFLGPDPIHTLLLSLNPLPLIFTKAVTSRPHIHTSASHSHSHSFTLPHSPSPTPHRFPPASPRPPRPPAQPKWSSECVSESSAVQFQHETLGSNRERVRNGGFTRQRYAPATCPRAPATYPHKRLPKSVARRKKYEWEVTSV